MEYGNNIRVIYRDNPLILEICIDPDTMFNDMPAASPESLTHIRSIINEHLLPRHYKILVVDLSGIVYGGVALFAKMIMLFEKAYSVSCLVYLVRVEPRFLGQLKLAGVDALVPVLSAEESPKIEDYDNFFFSQETNLLQKRTLNELQQIGVEESSNNLDSSNEEPSDTIEHPDMTTEEENAEGNQNLPTRNYSRFTNYIF